MIHQVPPDLPRTDQLHPVRPWLLRLVRPVFMFGCHRWWRIQVHGARHLPPRGPVIVAANHVGLIDGPLLVGLLARDAFAMAKYELFTGLLGRLLLLIGQVPINRWRPDPWAIRRCIRLLRDGQALIVYPEGNRGAGDFTQVRGGVAYLAMVTGAPIVPVALLGTRLAGQTKSELPPRGAPIHVVFGEPIRLGPQGWPRRKAEVAECAGRLRELLAAHVRFAQQRTGMTLPGPPRPKHLSAPNRARSA